MSDTHIYLRIQMFVMVYLKSEMLYIGHLTLRLKVMLSFATGFRVNYTNLTA